VWIWGRGGQCEREHFCTFERGVYGVELAYTHIFFRFFTLTLSFTVPLPHTHHPSFLTQAHTHTLFTFPCPPSHHASFPSCDTPTLPYNIPPDPMNHAKYLRASPADSPFGSWYGVATISKLLQIIGLFCNRAFQKRPYSAKATYILRSLLIVATPYLIGTNRFQLTVLARRTKTTQQC